MMSSRLLAAVRRRSGDSPSASEWKKDRKLRWASADGRTKTVPVWPGVGEDCSAEGRTVTPAELSCEVKYWPMGSEPQLVPRATRRGRWRRRLAAAAALRRAMPTSVLAREPPGVICGVGRRVKMAQR